MPTRSLRRRPFWLWPAITLVALAAALMVAAWLARPAQPIHAGRPLLAWVADLGSARPEDRQAASKAILAVGTNGLPALTWALRRGDSLVGRVVIASEKSLPRQIWFALWRVARPDQAPQQRALAVRALGLLGPAAEPALPHLSELLRDRHFTVVVHVTSTMSRIGPPAVPYLANALPDADTGAKSCILVALGVLWPAAAPAAPGIVTALITGTDPNTPLQAEQTLARIGTAALPALVAALSQALTNTETTTRIEAAIAAIASQNSNAFATVEGELHQAPAALKPALLRAVQRVTAYPKRRALIVARMLTDADPALRAAAADWLRQHSSPAELERPLATESESLRRHVAEVFGTNSVSPVPISR